MTPYETGKRDAETAILIDKRHNGQNCPYDNFTVGFTEYNQGYNDTRHKLQLGMSREEYLSLSFNSSCRETIKPAQLSFFD